MTITIRKALEAEARHADQRASTLFQAAERIRFLEFVLGEVVRESGPVEVGCPAGTVLFEALDAEKEFPGLTIRHSGKEPRT